LKYGKLTDLHRQLEVAETHLCYANVVNRYYGGVTEADIAEVISSGQAFRSASWLNPRKKTAAVGR